ncbi:MAG: hypothetical protein WEE67_09920 [Chloroflexota bacterium]
MNRFVSLLLASFCLGAAMVLLAPRVATAFDGSVEVAVETWTSIDGRAYVGVQAAGQWAVPASKRVEVVTPYYSVWDLVGLSVPSCRLYWVWVYRTADDEFINPASPMAVVTCERNPGIDIRPEAYGDLSLYLDVAVDPVSAPARTERTVSARLTLAWMDAIGGYLSAYVDHDSVRVDSWTVDFGDGTVRSYPRDPRDPEGLTASHRYDAAGSFDAVVTAHISGQAYAAFFAPGGAPVERVIPFTVDISNRAAGISAQPIEYVPPIVDVGAAPSGTLPDGTIVSPDASGHAQLWWPRGLLCQLYPRAIVIAEGVMRSGGLTIGGATTRLVAYRYEAGVNDASAPTASGHYPAAEPIRIQWNTPLPDQGSYPVRLVLELETTYDDGTVRTYEAAGSVDVTVVYSAVSGP